MFVFACFIFLAGLFAFAARVEVMGRAMTRVSHGQTAIHLSIQLQPQLSLLMS
ncbi:hypothetical protein Hanom_Chr10g00938821 [Helianthus anomalus]